MRGKIAKQIGKVFNDVEVSLPKFQNFNDCASNPDKRKKKILKRKWNKLNHIQKSKMGV